MRMIDVAKAEADRDDLYETMIRLAGKKLGPIDFASICMRLELSFHHHLFGHYQLGLFCKMFVCFYITLCKR
jgi:hypothetical protein